MKYSEETLKSWTAPLSKTEEDRAENAIILSDMNSLDVSDKHYSRKKRGFAKTFIRYL